LLEAVYSQWRRVLWRRQAVSLSINVLKRNLVSFWTDDVCTEHHQRSSTKDQMSSQKCPAVLIHKWTGTNFRTFTHDSNWSMNTKGVYHESAQLASVHYLTTAA
jgi:hypothetical protein